MNENLFVANQKLWLGERVCQFLSDIARVDITYAIELISAMNLIVSTQKMSTSVNRPVSVEGQEGRWYVNTSPQFQKACIYAGINRLSKIMRIETAEELSEKEISEENILLFDVSEVDDKLVTKIQLLTEQNCFLILYASMGNKIKIESTVDCKFPKTVVDMRLDIVTECGMRLAEIFDVIITKHELKKAIWDLHCEQMKPVDLKTAAHILKIKMQQQRMGKQCNLFDLTEDKKTAKEKRVTETKEAEASMTKTFLGFLKDFWLK